MTKQYVVSLEDGVEIIGGFFDIKEDALNQAKEISEENIGATVLVSELVDIHKVITKQTTKVSSL